MWSEKNDPQKNVTGSEFKENDSVSLVRLEAHCVLQMPSPSSNNEFRLFPNGLIKDSNRLKMYGIGQPEF